jgi:hypothetical protein
MKLRTKSLLNTKHGGEAMSTDALLLKGNMLQKRVSQLNN